MDRLSPRETRKATPPASNTIQKSLAIPKHTPPDEYRAYVEHPEVATLNQIMLHYLGMEEILKLYSQNHEQFETRQALNTLAQRFDLYPTRSFEQLLQSYDMKYATVRSYLYYNRTPEQILLGAALEGNIQALYNQLKLYPELREEVVYNQALEQAAKGGHEAIIDLLFELGAEDVDRTVLKSAAKGGQLALLLKELAKDVKTEYIKQAIRYATINRNKAVLAVLLDYSTTSYLLDEAMAGAGMSGDTTIIEYVISRGGNDYQALIIGASTYRHFDTVRQYWSKLPKNNFRLNDIVLSCAASYKDLEMVKFLVARKLVSKAQLENSLDNLKRKRRHSLLSQRTDKSKYVSADVKIAALDSIIAYLESKGIVTQDAESSEESMSD